MTNVPDSFDVPDSFSGLADDVIAVAVCAMKLVPGSDVAKVIRAVYTVPAGGGIEMERMRVMHAASVAGMRLGVKMAEEGWRADPPKPEQAEPGEPT